KFIYGQKDKASSALDDAFSEKEKDSDVLFYIPVTKEWLQQVVLSLILICHSSYGGIIEFFRDILNQNICKGTIFNIVQRALTKAAQVNRAQDLSSIQVGAHDEIFQGRIPVLVGCDVESTYTYLLKQAEHRDTTTWGTHLLELTDQGMALDHTIADGGKGLRSGQREAWPDVPCRGDVFHPLYDIGKVVTFLENRASALLEVVEKLEIKMEKAKKKNQGTKYSKRLAIAREESVTAVQLKNDIVTLSSWLKKDILSVTGPDLATRRELLDFVVEELQSREALSPHRIRPVRRLLECQGEELLCFVEFLDEDLQGLAYAYDTELYLVRQVFELQAIPSGENRYWEQAATLNRKLGTHFYGIQEAIRDLIKNTVRASSIVENINSRLRNYFFLRKTLGHGYLELLQYFLNHRRFMRSSRSERIGKSPKELLTGESHGHWLELLGYNLFKRASRIEKQSTVKKAA
ncbi:MAG TPA: hypothetical protein EYG21_02285, partial [Nitrospinaceae bacterium]|nr:hypothetical protein [Nitrospinaceae bacterium]